MRLTIDLDPATARGLSDRARRHGRSLEAEARAVIERDAAARGPAEDARTDAPTATELLAGFERFRTRATEPSLTTMRRLRERARADGANGATE